MGWQKSDCLIVVMKSVKADGAKGSANQQFPKRSTSDTGGYENVAHELKEIRYQSKTYARLETLMNRVNETSIKELQGAEQTASKEEHEVQELFTNLEVLHYGAAFDKRHMELETDVGLKSRMRENRTYGSVRGTRQAFHLHNI